MRDDHGPLMSAWHQLEQQRLQADRASQQTSDVASVQNRLAREMIADFIAAMAAAGNPATIRCQLRRLKGRGQTFQPVPGAYVTGWIVTWRTATEDEPEHTALLDTSGVLWTTRQISVRQWIVRDPAGTDGQAAHFQPHVDMAISLAATMHANAVAPISIRD